MTTDDPLVMATPEPQVGKLIDEFKQCHPYANFSPRTQDADDVRYCRWPNQSSDFKHHNTDQENAPMYDGASDLREPLADDVIDEGVCLDTLAFTRALLEVKARGIEDLEQAGDMTRLIQWLTQTRMRNLLDENEHSSQWRRSYGWVALKIFWKQGVQLVNREMAWEDVQTLSAQAAQQNPNSPFALLEQMLLEPTLDDQTAEMFKQLYAVYVKKDTQGIFGDQIPNLPKSRFKAFVKQLRETQKATVPCPHITENEPAIVAKKPWEEIFFRPETSDIQRTAVFEKEWVTEVDLRERIITDKYDEAWVDEVVKHKGEYSMFGGPNDYSALQSTTASFSGCGWFTWNAKSNLIEILHVYQRQLDANGVPGIYHTVIHAHVTQDDRGRELYGLHELNDYEHGLSPFVIGRFERPTRRIMDSRGIPEKVACEQRQLKVQQDAIIDNVNWAAGPTILEPMGYQSQIAKLNKSGGMQSLKPRYGPFSRVPYRPGMEPKFMERPAAPNWNFELWEKLGEKVDRRFGRFSQTAHPALVQAKQQKQIHDHLSMWRQAFMQAIALVHQYMPDETYERVTGAPKKKLSANEIMNSYDLIMYCDAREFDTEFLDKKLAMFAQFVTQYDRNGRYDMNVILDAFARSIDPNIQRAAVRPESAGTAQLYDKVQKDFALMALGNEVPYTDAVDPTSQTQIQMAQQIVQSNPKYQQMFQADPRFKALVDNWEKNRMQSMKQLDNVQIGKTGVKPVGAGAP